MAQLCSVNIAAPRIIRNKKAKLITRGVPTADSLKRRQSVRQSVGGRVNEELIAILG